MAQARPRVPPPQHAEPDQRPPQVGHQRHLPQVPGDAVPRLHEARPAGHVRGTTRRPASTPAGDVRLEELRHRVAAGGGGGERDGGQRGVPAGAGVRVVDVVLQNTVALNNKSEMHPWHLHGHDFWAGARLRRRQVRPGEGHGQAKFNLERPRHEEHGGAAPRGS